MLCNGSIPSKSQGKVFNPTGDGKFAPISPYDIAAVAALALISSGHEGKAYDITGSQLLSTHDQVHPPINVEVVSICWIHQLPF